MGLLGIKALKVEELVPEKALRLENDAGSEQ